MGHNVRLDRIAQLQRALEPRLGAGLSFVPAKPPSRAMDVG
jgi:hypothetical protein